MRKKLESSLQTKILKDLRSYGKYIEAFKIQKASDNGVPDIFFTSKLTGAVLVELKQEGKKPRKLQESKINKLNSCGSKAFSCDSWSKWVKLKSELEINLESIITIHNQLSLFD